MIAALKEHAAGTPTQELCRRPGVGAETVEAGGEAESGGKLWPIRDLHAPL